MTPFGLDFLKRMLELNPKKRWSAKQLLNHNWLLESEETFGAHTIKVNKILKGLRNFTSHDYLHNIIYFYTTSEIMNREEKRKLTSIFASLDEDNDGRLSYEELINSFMRSGRSKERSAQIVDKALQELDLDPEEGIEYSHFLVTCCKKSSLINDQNLQRAFSLWDNN